MKSLFFIYIKNQKSLEIIRDIFLGHSYKEKGLKDPLTDKDFVISSDEEILNSYKRIKNDSEFDITFIGFDDSTHLEEYRIYHYRNHFTHYFDIHFIDEEELKTIINLIIASKEQHKTLIMFESFGFKFSNPIDVDVVIDARCLPNPYWFEELRYKCGLDIEIKEYVFETDDAKEYLKRIEDYISFYIENMEKRNSRMPLIGIACTGGQHRSIAVTEYLKQRFEDKYLVYVKHREINRFLCQK